MKTSKRIRAGANDKTFRTALADVAIVAGEEGERGKRGPARFNMQVYTGGAMMLEGYDLPVVVDLAGMKRKNSLKANLDHVRSQRVGDVQDYQNDGRSLQLAGLCNAASASRNEVVDSAMDGYKWQASIEAADHTRERIAKSRTVQVNGQTFKGPIIVVRDSTLTGFAFVSHGADDQTNGTIAAGAAIHREGKSMDKELEKWIEAQGFDPAALSDGQVAVLRGSFEASRSRPAGTLDSVIEAEAARHARLEKIKDLTLAAMRQYPNQREQIQAMAREAEGTEMSAKDFELNLLRGTRPQSGSFLAESTRHGLNDDLLEAAICITGKLSGLEDHYDERLLDAADRAFRRGLHLSDVLQIAAKENGHAVQSRHDTEALLMGAFPDRREVRAHGWSGINLSVILSNVASKFLGQGFNAVDQSWRKISAIGNHSNFQEKTTAAVTGDMSFQPLGPSGAIQHGKLGEVYYRNQLDTKALLLILQRKDIINDDLGALTGQSVRMGRGGATGFCRDFWTVFLADHATYFPTDNSKLNYFEGAGTTLQHSQLGVAAQMFMDQVDVDSLPLGIEPKILLVSTGNKVTADELYQSTNLNTGGSSTSTKVPNKNTFAGKYEPVCSPYLSNARMGGAYSSLAWYLMAHPDDLPFIESAFLNGKDTPTMDTAEADFEHLGIKLRGIYDYGIRKWEYRAAVKAKGQG